MAATKGGKPFCRLPTKRLASLIAAKNVGWVRCAKHQEFRLLTLIERIVTQQLSLK